MISIIVPVYKTEKYLNKCVDSLLQQTYKDFELILVDDGSPDNCGRICDDYKELDRRVVVIHQDNRGLSAARNTGIDWVFENSESEWLTFVDSDDFVHPQMLELLYSKIKDTPHKFIAGDFTRYESYEDIQAEIVDATEVNAVEMEPEDFFLLGTGAETTAWGKLYHRSCFDEIRYPVGKIYEGSFTTYKIIFSLPSILHLEYPIYYYYTNPEGISNSRWTPKQLDIFEAYQEQLAFLEEKGYLRALEKPVLYYANTMHHQIMEISGQKQHRPYLRKMQRMLKKHLKRYANVPRLRDSRKLNAYKAACSKNFITLQHIVSVKNMIRRLGISKDDRINSLGKCYIKHISRKISKRRTIKPVDFPIDFVVTWVDGNDMEWLKEKNRYLHEYDPQTKSDNPSIRFRDWDTLRYWFRAVEKYAPWVNRVYFVTCGQTPDWLNTEHPKLRLIDHSDYIPKEFLPTFNSHVIENNLWRIEELSEHFIYFNDDMFLGKEVQPEDFFTNGLPKLCSLAVPSRPTNNMISFQHVLYNNLGEINSMFDMNKVISKHREKWLNYKYNDYFEYNSRVYRDRYLSGMIFTHLAVPFRKSRMREGYEAFYDKMHLTSTHKFRSFQDVNHQLFQLWEMVHGTFEPVARRYYGKWLSIEPKCIKEIEEHLSLDTNISFCLNDSESIDETMFPEYKKKIHSLLDKKLGEPSSFEKQD